VVNTTEPMNNEITFAPDTKDAPKGSAHVEYIVARKHGREVARYYMFQGMTLIHVQSWSPAAKENFSHEQAQRLILATLSEHYDTQYEKDN